MSGDIELRRLSEQETAVGPEQWPFWKRLAVSMSICVKSLFAITASSIYTPGIPGIVKEFDVTLTVATLGLSLYVLGFVFGPTILSPMSEVYGRNFVYRPSWIAFFFFQLGTALSKNIESFLICRFLSGAIVGTYLTVPMGTMADIWEKEKLPPWMGILLVMAHVGPIMGPFIGGFLVQYLSWRAPLWFMVIASGVLGLDLLWLPETYKPVLVARQALNETTRVGIIGQVWKKRSVRSVSVLRNSIWRPLQLLVLDPIVLLISLYISFVNTILYIYFGAYPLVFEEAYGFTISHVGLAFLGLGFGVLLGGASARRVSSIYLKLRQKHEIPATAIYPEGRLPLSIGAAVAIPISLFWFAWTGNSHVHWIVPILSGIPFGWGILVLNVSFFMYLAETYRSYAASVFASLTILRSLFAFAFPLFVPQMYDALTPHWAGSLLGFIAVLFMPIPFLFFKYGAAIRQKSQYKPSQ